MACGVSPIGYGLKARVQEFAAVAQTNTCLRQVVVHNATAAGCYILRPLEIYAVVIKEFAACREAPMIVILSEIAVMCAAQFYAPIAIDVLRLVGITARTRVVMTTLPYSTLLAIVGDTDV